MNGKELFEEGYSKVKKVVDMFNGKVTLVVDNDNKIVYQNGASRADDFVRDNIHG